MTIFLVNVRGALFEHLHETPEQSYKKFEQWGHNKKVHARQPVKFVLGILHPLPYKQDSKSAKNLIFDFWTCKFLTIFLWNVRGAMFGLVH